MREGSITTGENRLWPRRSRLQRLLQTLVRALLPVAMILMVGGEAFAQQPDTTDQARQDSIWQAQQDSLWRDLGLDTAGFEFGESDLFDHYSHGWFPQAGAAQTLLLTSMFLYADEFDVAHNIRSRAFVPTTAPFDRRNPFEGDERTILKSNSDEEADDGYPVTDFAEFGLSYTYNLPMPAVLRADASLQIVDGLIYSNDTTRSYLTLSGLKRPLKEVGVITLEQYALSGKIGLNIPIYGVFLDWEAFTISSYYYLHAGVSAAYTVSSKATQYMQIANAKDELRYGNGADTVVVMDNVRLAGLQRLRTGLDMALGWNFAAAFGTFFVEAFVSVPSGSLLDDAYWGETYAGLRIGIGYQWLPEKKGK